MMAMKSWLQWAILIQISSVFTILEGTYMNGFQIPTRTPSVGFCGAGVGTLLVKSTSKCDAAFRLMLSIEVKVLGFGLF